MRKLLLKGSETPTEKRKGVRSFTSACSLFLFLKTKIAIIPICDLRSSPSNVSKSEVDH